MVSLPSLVKAVCVVVILPVSLAALTDRAHGQATITAPPTTSPANPATDRQREWLQAGLNARVQLSERLGEEGGKAFAKSKGWTDLLGGNNRTLPHGPDQVYRGGDGTVHVIEAKGGSGQLGRGYGHAQGSSEWAVEAAKRIARNPAASEAERQAARATLEAAAKGRLEVHVIRTTHTRGEPHVAKLEQTVKCSEAARRVASESLDDIAKAAARTVPSGVKTAAEMATATDDLARVATSTPSAAAVPAKVLARGAVVLDAGMRVADGVATERRFESGEITSRERAVAHGRNAAGMVGGTTGAWAGAEAGAAGGAAIGTFICPGFGTAAGGFIGGFVGGIGGYFAGDAVAAAGAEAAIDATYGR